MSTFETAWPTILRHEGGYCNNANDLGGPTKYGLSLRWLKAQGYFPSDTDLRVEIKEIWTFSALAQGARVLPERY